jgi:dienelactone hydrolase
LPESFEIEGADGGPLRGDLYRPGEATAPSVLVICHGFRAYKDWGFLPMLAERVAADGIAAVTFNFTDSGITDRAGTFGEPERYRAGTYGQELEDIRRVLDWVERDGAAPVGLAGHSRGGALALLTAARDPRVRCVCTLAAPSRIMVWPDPYWEAWRRGESAITYDFRTRSRLPLGPEIYRDLERNRERYEVPRATASIAVPLLVVQGDRDASVPAEEARAIAERAPAASTELRMIEGADHGFLAGDTIRRTPPQLLDMIEAVAAWMRRWLLVPAEVRPRRGRP